ncbi:MAG TPA: CopD family protein [Nitrospirota bacterium]|nr:CopD family protein [Nitrospirota bacterium]
MNIILHSIPVWFEIISLAFCIGTLMCRSWVFSPALLLSVPDRRRLLRRMWGLFGIAIAIIIACSAADLISRTAQMSGRPVEAALPLIPAVIQKTHFGWIWIIRIAGLILAALLTMAGARHRDSPALLYILLGLTTLIAWTESASGHASDKGDFTVSELTDWLHLLGATVWGGGLFVLSLIILPHLKKHGTEALPAIAGLVSGFSRIAGWAAGMIALTSLHHAWVYVGSLEALEETPYGNLVMAKIVLFLLLVILAAFNRYLFMPLLQSQAGLPSHGHGFLRRLFILVTSPLTRRFKSRMTVSWLLRSIRTEVVLMLAVLMCVALLRQEIPASHYLHHDHSGAGHMPGTFASIPPPVIGPIVSLETVPAEISAGIPVKMIVRIEDKDGKPLTGLVSHQQRILHAVIVGQDLRTFAHIHPEDLGPVTKVMIEQAVFPLRYTFPKSGNYLVGLDFATANKLYGDTILINAMGSPSMTGPDIDLSRSKKFGTYRVSLASSPGQAKTGEETTLTWHIEQDGKPVTDLQPYLGAAMHISAVSANLQHFMHIHGMLPGETRTSPGHEHAALPGKFGPDIASTVFFPSKGIYALFGQVSHEGKVHLFEFMVEVR